jgi:hypothetical protein
MIFFFHFSDNFDCCPIFEEKGFSFDSKPHFPSEISTLSLVVTAGPKKVDTIRKCLNFNLAAK